MNEVEFKDAREHLLNQTERVVLELREAMVSVDKEDILENEIILCKLIEHIVAAYDGIKKTSSVMEFIDAWEENGDLPSLGLTDDKQIIKNFVGGNDNGTNDPGGSPGVPGETDSELL